MTDIDYKEVIDKLAMIEITLNINYYRLLERVIFGAQ